MPRRLSAVHADKTPGDYRYKSQISFRLNKREMKFDVAEGLFSSVSIDSGTAFLLRWLSDSKFDSCQKVLDLGSGYGPIGIALALFNATREVLCVDRDALAVEYSTRNAALNGVATQVACKSSVGYNNIDARHKFDLVVSNVPAKLGPAGLSHFLFDGSHLLSEGGQVAVVVVDQLCSEVERQLAERNVTASEYHYNKGYGVYVFCPSVKDQASQIEEKLDAYPTTKSAKFYKRGDYQRFSFESTCWDAPPTYTLPEFDTLAFSTQLAMKVMPLNMAAYVIVGVGHGHIAAFLRTNNSKASIGLVDRDLLALEVTRETLHQIGEVDCCQIDPFELALTPATNTETNAGAAPILPEVFAQHLPRPEGFKRRERDCVIFRVDIREPVNVTAEALARVINESSPASLIVLHGRSVDISRIVEMLTKRRIKIAVKNEARTRGFCAMLLSATKKSG